MAAPEHLRGRRVIASISGGKDSAAMSLYLHELGVEHERVFMDTGWENPLTYEYLRGPLTLALGPIVEIRAQWTFEQLVDKRGLFPSRNVRFCTQELKVRPMQRYLAALPDTTDIVNAVGIRRAESKARSQMAEWEWSDGFDCEVWRPLVTWTEQQVIDIHARHGLRLNPLYGLGARRVGCWPCIHARKSELALVASVDPERIKMIADQESALSGRELGAAAQTGKTFVPRTMFSYHGGDSKHYSLPIYEAVAWANSKRGEWQPAAVAEGCMRFGLCETEESP